MFLRVLLPSKTYIFQKFNPKFLNVRYHMIIFIKLMTHIKLRTVRLKQYIYGDENKDVQIVCFLQKK